MPAALAGWHLRFVTRALVPWQGDENPLADIRDTKRAAIVYIFNNMMHGNGTAKQFLDASGTTEPLVEARGLRKIMDAAAAAELGSGADMEDQENNADDQGNVCDGPVKGFVRLPLRVSLIAGPGRGTRRPAAQASQGFHQAHRGGEPEQLHR